MSTYGWGIGRPIPPIRHHIADPPSPDMLARAESFAASRKVPPECIVVTMTPMEEYEYSEYTRQIAAHIHASVLIPDLKRPNDRRRGASRLAECGEMVRSFFQATGRHSKSVSVSVVRRPIRVPPAWDSASSRRWRPSSRPPSSAIPPMPAPGSYCASAVSISR